MKVAGDYVFSAPPDTVWKALLDPDVLAATMPGCEKLELVGENQYEGALNIRIGPVQGNFQGRIELEDIESLKGYSIKIDGKGAPGFVRATVRVDLEPEADGTRIIYDGDAQVGGRIASVGQRLLDSSAKVIIRQSLEGLDATLTAHAAAPAGEEVAVERPSPAGFAAKVAKGVVQELIPKPVLIGAVVLMVLVILFFLIR